MTTKTLRTAVLTALTVASLLGALSTRAAIITWTLPNYLQADTDVDTSGTLVGAYGLNQLNTSNSITINTVTFITNAGSLTMLTNATTGTNFVLSGFTTHYASFATNVASPFSSLSQNYRNLMSNGIYVGSLATIPVITATNLVIGHEYHIQVWANDSRGGRTSADYANLYGASGGNTVAMYYNSTGAVGGVGSWSTGDFVADGPTQSFTIYGYAGSGQADTYLNAIQLRNLGVGTSNFGIGYWDGLAGNNSLDSNSLNFSTNLDTAPVGTAASLTTLEASTNACFFADSYYSSSTLVPVTSTNINVAAGGVSFGAASSGMFNFLNSAVTYILTSSDVGIIDGSGGQTALNKYGTGTLILDGANSYSGGTFINEGKLQVGNADANGSLGANTSVSYVTDNASLVFDRSDSPTINNPISGYGSLTQAGSGALTLAGNNAILGNITIISNGFNELSVTGSLNGATYAGAISVASNSTLNFDSFNAQTFSGVISGAGSVTQTAQVGQLTLSGANTFTGGLNVGNNDIVQLNATTAGGAAAGTIALNTSGALTLQVAATYANPITGGASSAINVVLPAGNTIMSGSCTNFNGTFNVEQATTSGQLVINVATFTDNSTATWSIANGATVDFATPFLTNYGAVTLNGVGNNAAYGSLRLDACTQLGNVLLQNNTTIGNGNAGVGTISGIISDYGAPGYGFVLMSGLANSIISLTGANTYHGLTVVSNTMTLRIGAGGSIANSSGVLLGSGTRLDVASNSGFTIGSSQTLADSAGSATINGSLTMASGATLALTNLNGVTPLIITNGTMTLNAIAASLTVSSFTPAPGANGYLLISAGTGGSVVAGGSFGTPTATIYGLPGGSINGTLSIVGGSLYLSVSGSPATIAGYSPYTLTNLYAFQGQPGPTYSIAALGSGLSYFWYTNGVLAAGANSTSFTPVTTSLAAGPFTVSGVASNSIGTNANTWVFNVVATNTLAPYPQAVLFSNTPPIAYWRLDEASQDSSGNPNRPVNDFMNGQDDGIYTNVLLGQGGYTGPSGTDPNETSALFASYATTQSYASISSATTTNFGGSGTVNFSVEAWVTGGAEVASSCIITKGEYGNNESFLLGFNSSGQPNNVLRFWPRAFNGSVDEVLSTVAFGVNTGVFHHLVGVCDETHGAVTLYIDGTNAVSGSISTTAGVETNIYPVLIGSGTTTSFPSTYQQYHGNIDDVAIYNYALTAAQVTAHYVARGVGPTIGPLPASTNVDQNSTLVLAPQITGSATLYYFWYYNSGPTPISTNASLTLADIQPGQAGSYELLVSNSLGTASASVSVNVNTGGPVINPNPEPTSLVLYAGLQHTYSVAATGTDPLYYQWFVTSNNMPSNAISGATSPSYTATAVAGYTNVYFCQVSNAYGGFSFANSSTATLVGVPLPTSLYELTVLSNNPVAYWPLDEQPDSNNLDGNDTVIANDYAGGHNALYTSADLGELGLDTTTDSNTAALFGIFATPNSFAGEINNSGNGLPVIDFATVPGGGAGNAEFSIECWVKTTNAQPALSTIISKGFTNGTAQFVLEDYGGSFGFWCRDFASQALDGGSTGVVLNDGNWHYLVAVIDQADLVQGNIQLYNNAVNVGGFQFQSGKGITDPTGGTDPAAHLVSIGAGASLSSSSTLVNQFQGTIAEVALYNYPLTPAEISNHFNQSGITFLSISGPEPQAVLAGAAVPMTAAVTGGKPPLTYQWQQNGTNITDGTTNTLQLTGVPSTAGSYDLVVSNSPYVPAVTSAVVSVTLAPDLTLFTNGAGWSAQGNTYQWLGNNALELTDNTGAESNSVFYWAPVYVGAFQASFTYQCIATGTPADGATFCIQNDPRGAQAIGQDGGNLGYGATNNGITNSVAFEINIDGGGAGVGGVGVAFDTNGAIGPNVKTTNESPSLVFTNGDIISNFVIYNGTTLAVTMTDVSASSPNYGAVYSTNTTMNIPVVLGTNIAYVGFTAADGSSKSTQIISNFTYIPFISLSIQPSGSSVVFSWPTGVGGYVLETNDNLTTTNWVEDLSPVSVVGNQYQVTEPESSTALYYQLVLPGVTPLSPNYP